MSEGEERLKPFTVNGHRYNQDRFKPFDKAERALLLEAFEAARESWDLEMDEAFLRDNPDEGRRRKRMIEMLNYMESGIIVHSIAPDY